MSESMEIFNMLKEKQRMCYMEAFQAGKLDLPLLKTRAEGKGDLLETIMREMMPKYDIRFCPACEEPFQGKEQLCDSCNAEAKEENGGSH